MRIREVCVCPFFHQQVVGGISHENGIAYRELRGQLCDEPERMRIATAGKLDISTNEPALPSTHLYFNRVSKRG